MFRDRGGRSSGLGTMLRGRRSGCLGIGLRRFQDRFCKVPGDQSAIAALAYPFLAQDPRTGTFPTAASRPTAHGWHKTNTARPLAYLVRRERQVVLGGVDVGSIAHQPCTLCVHPYRPDGQQLQEVGTDRQTLSDSHA